MGFNSVFKGLSTLTLRIISEYDKESVLNTTQIISESGFIK